MPSLRKSILILLTLSLLMSCDNKGDNNQRSETASSDSFRFFINADPQMGPENTDKNGLQILNELLEMFVEEVNRETKKDPIDFVIYNGDLVWDPYQDAFDNFTRIVKQQEVPTYLVHGNHDGYNDDPKFFEAQQQLSGFKKLNYSFDRGNWRFVIIGAPEKYLQEDQKQAQLNWLKNELETHKDKQIMLFMHYHIMPVGLSQMEFYTYWPISFKNQMLDTITNAGNVKYVFSGHVHSGIKASVKSSIEYKGIKFINCPTPVMGRPFGEEYPEFQPILNNRYTKRGFYLEVEVSGDEVKLIGHKIDNDFEVVYPKEINKFKKGMDPRFFKPESLSQGHPELINGSFDNRFKGWKKSYRYKKDKSNAFKNSVIEGQNILRMKSPWGSWTFDEYMETYQILDFDINKNNILKYQFKKPKYSKKGAGGFIKVLFYNEANQREEFLLFHWGHQEDKVKFAYQSWLYNSDGQRGASRQFNDLIEQNNLMSIPLTFDKSENQTLEIDLNAILQKMDQDLSTSKINKISIAHGVWTRILMKDSNIRSELIVDQVDFLDSGFDFENSTITLNDQKLTTIDKAIPYFDFENKRTLKKKKR